MLQLTVPFKNLTPLSLSNQATNQALKLSQAAERVAQAESAGAAALSEAQAQAFAAQAAAQEDSSLTAQ